MPLEVNYFEDHVDKVDYLFSALVRLSEIKSNLAERTQI
jgi:hypothetical protein